MIETRKLVDVNNYRMCQYNNKKFVCSEMLLWPVQCNDAHM